MLPEDLKARFDRETQGNPIVIYMKGNAMFPQCGFSAATVEALKPYGKLFTVDVLKDPAVRENLKLYSNWPTFPQVFIHGQFVGGCDIVRELEASGELQKLVAQGADASRPPSP